MKVCSRDSSSPWNTRWLRVFLLGGTPESNEGAYSKLKTMHEELPVVGRHHGYFTDDEAVVAEINDSRSDMLFVALGSPRQEKWVAKYRKQLEVPFCMGVGGSVDVLSGKAHLAPALFRQMGMEWHYRLLREPKRCRRQAVLPIFVLGLLWHYFSTKVTPPDPHDMTLKSIERTSAQSALHRY